MELFKLIAMILVVAFPTLYGAGYVVGSAEYGAMLHYQDMEHAALACVIDDQQVRHIAPRNIDIKKAAAYAAICRVIAREQL
jgi:hypothetical protein